MKCSDSPASSWHGKEDRSRFSECIFVSTDGVTPQPKSVYRILNFHKKKAMEITKNGLVLILTNNDLQFKKWNVTSDTTL